jgi:glycerol-3-phosphate cytidylyltransferase
MDDENLTPEGKAPRRVLTYGTFDTLHWGHIRLLERAKRLAYGGELVVAVSTDEFNAIKGKKAYHDFETRKRILRAVRYVDLIIPEESWDQKRSDIERYAIDCVVMGDDWKSDEHFTKLSEVCDLVFLPRTKSISSTQIRAILAQD